MKISARNQLFGKVKSVNNGPINAEVVIELAAGLEVTAIVTRSSSERLGLKAGSQACAIIKASDVMVGICGGGEGCDCQGKE